MWKRSVWVVALVAVMMLAVVLPIQAKSADHRVNGSAHLVNTIGNRVSVMINARSFDGPLTGTGKVTLRSSGSINYRMGIDVDCLRVDLTSGKAWVSGVVESASGDAWEIGRGMLVIVRDVPGGPDELVSTLANPGGPGPFPTPACLTDVISVANAFDSGNIKVK